MCTTSWSVQHCLPQEVILYCLYADGVVIETGHYTEQRGGHYSEVFNSINGASIQTTVVDHYKVGVCNSEVSAKKGSTVYHNTHQSSCTNAWEKFYSILPSCALTQLQLIVSCNNNYCVQIHIPCTQNYYYYVIPTNEQ